MFDVEKLREGVNGNKESFQLRQDAADEIERLRKLIIDYVNERDNKVPDYNYRIVLLDRLREEAILKD